MQKQRDKSESDCDEWASFCSSCKNSLQSVFSEPPNFDEIFDEPENNSNISLEEFPVTVNVGTDINGLTNGNNLSTIPHYSRTKQTNKRKRDEMDNLRYKKIKCDEFVLGEVEQNGHKLREILDANTVNDEMSNVTYTFHDFAREKIDEKCAEVTNLNEFEEKVENKSTTSEMFFGKSLLNSSMSSTKSMVPQGILDRRKNIIEKCNRLLLLGTYVDNIREAIIEKAHGSKTLSNSRDSTLPNHTSSIVKTNSSEDYPIYYYNKEIRE